MTLTIKIDQNSCKKDVSCHMLPCNIQHNGFSNVSKYFKVREDKDILTSSLRGYPLEGQKIAVPANYTGVIFRENKSNDSEDRELKATGTFNEFVIWNWDKNPAIERKFSKALQWLDVAATLHAPVSTSDNGSSSPQKQRKRKFDD